MLGRHTNEKRDRPPNRRRRARSSTRRAACPRRTVPRCVFPSEYLRYVSRTSGLDDGSFQRARRRVLRYGISRTLSHTRTLESFRAPRLENHSRQHLRILNRSLSCRRGARPPQRATAAVALPLVPARLFRNSHSPSRDLLREREKKDTWTRPRLAVDGHELARRRELGGVATRDLSSERDARTLKRDASSARFTKQPPRVSRACVCV